jgi:hypothetical protein
MIEPDTKEAEQRGMALAEAIVAAGVNFVSPTARDIAATALLKQVTNSVTGQGFIIEGVPIQIAVKRQLDGPLSFCLAPKSAPAPAPAGGGVQSGHIPAGSLKDLSPSERRAAMSATFGNPRYRRG